jgi:hypothetical protein
MGGIVGNADYVGEAAEALAAPGEIWLFRDDFRYDPASREWRFKGSDFPGLKLGGEVRDWLLRICDWLQGNYPAGPGCPCDGHMRRMASYLEQ